MRPRRRRPPRRAEPLVTLNTRIPRSVRRRVRLFCAEAGREMQDFITEAIDEKLLREQRRRARATSG